MCYTRLVSQLDFGSQGNITRRDTLKEDQLPYTYRNILYTTNLRGTALYEGRTSKIVVKAN